MYRELLGPNTLNATKHEKKKEGLFLLVFSEAGSALPLGYAFSPQHPPQPRGLASMKNKDLIEHIA